MGQKKIQRFAELKTFPNVLQFPENMKGKWDAFFKNDNPVILELACGKGEYAVGLGELFPQKNFIGVDLKGNRIWVGAKKALQNHLTNVAFLRTEIDKIADYFFKNEVSEIWITFPDPQLRNSKAKKKIDPSQIFAIVSAFSGSGRLYSFKDRQPGPVSIHKTGDRKISLYFA